MIDDVNKSEYQYIIVLSLAVMYHFRRTLMYIEVDVIVINVFFFNVTTLSLHGVECLSN
jgi:hypothetical protein